jgi:hypothetical protein
MLLENTYEFPDATTSEGHEVSVNLPLADGPLILPPFFGLHLNIVRGEIRSQRLPED